MTALVPSVVQKRYIPATATYGTPVRVVEYILVVTKAAQNDTVNAATYCPGTFLSCVGWTIDGSGDGAIDVITYTASGTLLTLTSANTGTIYMRVLCQEA